jgi:hypothetical protein
MEDGQHLGNITAESVDNPIVAHDDFSNGWLADFRNDSARAWMPLGRLTEAMIS